MKNLRVTVFEKAAKLIRDEQYNYCCSALDIAGARTEERSFFAKHYDNGKHFWFGHIPKHKRQKARERALLRCANLIRKARAKKKSKKLNHKKRKGTK